MGERLNKSSIMMASELPQRIRQRKHVSASFGVNASKQALDPPDLEIPFAVRMTLHLLPHRLLAH